MTLETLFATLISLLLVHLPKKVSAPIMNLVYEAQKRAEEMENRALNHEADLEEERRMHRDTRNWCDNLRSEMSELREAARKGEHGSNEMVHILVTALGGSRSVLANERVLQEALRIARNGTNTPGVFPLKIQAIKYLRAISGCGLKEAKDAFDAASGREPNRDLYGRTH
jgi:hypothetical protein